MEPRWKLRRIGIGSAMKIGAVLFCAIGFIIGMVWGIVLAFFSSLIGVMLDRPAPGMGAATVIVMPFFVAILYGIIGTILSFLVALFYNIAAGIMGGIEFELGFERREDTTSFI